MGTIVSIGPIRGGRFKAIAGGSDYMVMINTSSVAPDNGVVVNPTGFLPRLATRRFALQHVAFSARGQATAPGSPVYVGLGIGVVTGDEPTFGRAGAFTMRDTAADPTPKTSVYVACSADSTNGDPIRSVNGRPIWISPTVNEAIALTGDPASAIGWQVAPSSPGGIILMLFAILEEGEVPQQNHSASDQPLGSWSETNL